METSKQTNESYFKAKEKVRQVQIFYIHLIGYVILVGLLSYNLYIIEEGEYKNFFIWLNFSFIVGWTIFIATHAWRVFKGRIFFKKSWEERKIKEFLKEEGETTSWK